MLPNDYILGWERLSRKGDIPEGDFMKCTVNLMAWMKWSKINEM